MSIANSKAVSALRGTRHNIWHRAIRFSKCAQWAKRKATPETVLGDFDDAKAKYYEETVRFIRDGDSFAVEALGADGRRARFAVIYTFGIEPLQQYSVEVEPCRVLAECAAIETTEEPISGEHQVEEPA